MSIIIDVLIIQKNHYLGMQLYFIAYSYMLLINSIPNDKLFDRTNLKALTDKILDVAV